MIGIKKHSGWPVIRRLALTLSTCGLIIFLSTIPGDTRYRDGQFVWLIASTPVGLQKFLHVVAYASVAILWTWTLSTIRAGWLSAAVAFILATLLGGSLEWAQTMVPGRYGTLSDVLLNAAGAGLGAAFAVWFSRTKNVPDS